MTGLVRFVAALTILGASACGADGNDAYSVVADPAEVTERTLPPETTAPPAEQGEAEATATAEPGGPEILATTVAAAAPNGDVVEVRSLDNTYRQADIEVVAGTEVLWLNGGRNDHNVLPVDESQDWGIDTEDFTPGDEYRHLFDTPGVYLYYCSIHGTTTVGMVGSVTVVAPDA